MLCNRKQERGNGYSGGHGGGDELAQMCLARRDFLRIFNYETNFFVYISVVHLFSSINYESTDLQDVVA